MKPLQTLRLEKLSMLLGESVLRLQSFLLVVDDLRDGVVEVDGAELASIVAKILGLELSTIDQLALKLKTLATELFDERAVVRGVRHGRGMGSLVVNVEQGGAVRIRERSGFDLLLGSRTITPEGVPRACAALIVDRFFTLHDLASWLQARGIPSQDWPT